MKIRQDISGATTPVKHRTEQVAVVSKALRREHNRVGTEPVTFTASATIDETYRAVILDGNVSAVNLTLPDYESVLGIEFLYRCKLSKGNVTLKGTINGATDLALATGDSGIIKAGTDGWYTF